MCGINVNGILRRILLLYLKNAIYIFRKATAYFVAVCLQLYKAELSSEPVISLHAHSKTFN